MIKKTVISVLLSCAVLLMAGPAWAGITWKIDQPHAASGQPVRITGIVFNDSGAEMDWTPPVDLVLQWRSASGSTVRSTARLEGPAEQFNIPVNNFATAAWTAIVPSGLDGLQAVNVEGETVLLALDTTPGPSGRIVGSVAAVPVVDAGAAASPQGVDPALPDNVVTAAGASPVEGPAVQPVQSVGQAAPLSGFDRFRNAISPYEPIYFVVGNRGGRNARYQVSFKYRLFTPRDSADASFINHWYLGYTQTALWDLHTESHPFVDTSFKPSIFWRKEAILESRNKRTFLGLTTGVEHESNGKAGDDSRSINFAYVQPEFNYRFGSGSTLTFAPRIKTYFKLRDNPDYAKYAGHVDWKLRWARDDGFALTGLYRQGSGGRNMTQIDAAWPLRRTPLNMNGYLYAQWFKGYGETILGYSQKSGSQFRVGIALVP